MKGMKWGVIAVTAWVLCGCAAQPVDRPTQVVSDQVAPAIQDADHTEGWWSVRFFMDWPANTEPSWYMGTLLAHQVVAPVLNRHQNEISVWRFHRRAAPDASGHRLTFYFYSRPANAQQIMASVRYNELLSRLMAAGDILRTEYSDPRVNVAPDIEDTSDAKWSPALQKAWPYFIMGASQMWLDLIDKLIAERPPGKGGTTLEQTRQLYREVDAEVLRVRQNEGRHAFLHHLNAIFEYEPLWVYERRPLKF
jgi:hypothetical protein